ncbi:DUF6461 domain-containing protein [Kitasatospora sp. NPDC091207]|uniref:DUF6461 domain-containing protein n=1 Tax=Kitasatospora sp. NPDC091207 TaxID=3364083 RepID=UPI0037F3F6B1
MTAHASDYAWLETEEFAPILEAYCLTMVEATSGGELLRRFGAAPGRPVTGVEQVLAAWERYEDGDDGDGDDEDGDGDDGDEALRGREDEELMVVAVAELDGWAVALEVNGYLGSMWGLLPGLAEGTRLVSHFRNVNAVDHFHWQEGERNRLHFEPLFPAERDGSDADAVAELLAGVGFDLGTAEDRAIDRTTTAAFALGEELTGLRLTPEWLRTAEFVIGYAPQP